MQQDSWAKFTSTDKRPIHIPNSGFLFLHFLHQNKLGRLSICPVYTCTYRKQIPAELVIWPPLIRGLVYSKKYECLFLMDGTQPESGGKKKIKKK